MSDQTPNKIRISSEPSFLDSELILGSRSRGDEEAVGVIGEKLAGF